MLNKLTFLLTIIVLSLGLNLTHHESNPSTPNMKSTRQVITSFKLPYMSRFCTQPEQRYSPRHCYQKKDKCWGWCKNNNEPAKSMSQAQGKWCYIEGGQQCTNKKHCQTIKDFKCTVNSQCTSFC